jgi:hypothetical protein
MVLSWQKYYELNKHTGNVNEVATQYNMYLMQTENIYYEEMIHKVGGDSMFILQEGISNYVILQEGKNEYGILQEY